MLIMNRVTYRSMDHSGGSVLTATTEDGVHFEERVSAEGDQIAALSRLQDKVNSYLETNSTNLKTNN